VDQPTNALFERRSHDSWCSSALVREKKASTCARPSRPARSTSFGVAKHVRKCPLAVIESPILEKTSVR
jgi:hypothetical protein